MTTRGVDPLRERSWTSGVSTRKRLTSAAPSRETLEAVLPPFFARSADYWKTRA